MPKIAFNDVTIRNLPPPSEGQCDYWDSTPGYRGFGCRISQGGSRTWLLKKNNRRITLGRYPIVTLSQARSHAKQKLAQITLGQLPKPTARFKDALETYFAHHRMTCRPRTHAETKRLLSTHFLPDFEALRLDQVEKRHIAHILARLTRTPSEARHAFNALRAAYTFFLQRELADTSPCSNYPTPHKAHSRARVLSESELRSIIRNARSLPYPFSEIVELLAYLPLRRNEASALMWEYIDERLQLLTIPAALSKNHRARTLPYTPAVAHFLTNIPRSGPFLFPSARNKQRSFTGWSDGKTELDVLCQLPQWQLHDLRRTACSMMAAQGTLPHILQHLLGHSTGPIEGVHAVYNRHLYLNEQREALQNYHSRLTLILAEPANR